MPRATAALLVTGVLLAASIPGARAQITEAQVFVSEAILAFDEKRYTDALASLRQAREIEPDNLEALYYTGLVYLAQGQPTDAIPYLERARAQDPRNLSVAFQMGLAYFSLEQYDRAEPLLEEVFRVDPARDGLGYYVGFMRYRKKDYRGALAAFRAGTTTNPELQQLTRVYAGLAVGILGLPGQAAAEVGEALRVAPGSAVSEPVERLRETLTAVQRKERRLALQAQLGSFYDDNVTVIPDQDMHEPVVGELRHRAHESTGELAGLSINYAWLRTVDWESVIGTTLFGAYDNDLPHFNTFDALGNAGIARKFTLGQLPAQLGVQYSYDDLLLGDERFLSRHTPALSGLLVEGEHNLTQLFARYQNKDFHGLPTEPPAERRDADNWAVGLVHLFRFSQDRHFLRIGYQYDWEETDGTNYRYRGNRVLAGGQYTLPWYGVRLKYDLDVHLRGYTHKNTLFPTTAQGTERRQDTELTHIVRLELPLGYNLTLAAEYQAIDNDSNLAVFAYTRHVYSISLSWSY